MVTFVIIWFCVTVAMTGWLAFGCCLLATLDGETELMDWLDRRPVVIGVLLLCAWPLLWLFEPGISKDEPNHIDELKTKRTIFLTRHRRGGMNIIRKFRIWLRERELRSLQDEYERWQFANKSDAPWLSDCAAKIQALEHEIEVMEERTYGRSVCVISDAPHLGSTISATTTCSKMTETHHGALPIAPTMPAMIEPSRNR
jgi:hypothetical protein